MKTLSETQIENLKNELAREDLSGYTVVRMARKDVDKGNFDDAIIRLTIEQDKIRTLSGKLMDIIEFSKDDQKFHMYYF
jgi:predicted negative regulator of RcsB-dependent stress response